MSKVLIVDDDFMIADCLEEVLIDAGHEVCGIAGNVAEAVALGRRHRPDLAVVDLRLASGDLGTEVAAALRPLGVGVLYSTGNPGHPILKDAVGEGCIAKPYTAASIVAALRVVSQQMAKLPLSALPLGFKLLRA